jgi:uncharacterized protein (DUF488 family)
MTAGDHRPIFTVGHSTRPLDAFIELLREARVGRLVDVRGIPRSRTNPQYNLDTLPEALSLHQINHSSIPELGGRRPRQKAVAEDVNGFWQNRSFHNYADYAMSPAFRSGIERLLAASARETCAIMCSEAVWWRCHRRIIADYLLAADRRVVHLMGPGRAEDARMTPAAVVAGDHLVYPKEAGAADG